MLVQALHATIDTFRSFIVQGGFRRELGGLIPCGPFHSVHDLQVGRHALHVHELLVLQGEVTEEHTGLQRVIGDHCRLAALFTLLSAVVDNSDANRLDFTPDSLSHVSIDKVLGLAGFKVLPEGSEDFTEFVARSGKGHHVRTPVLREHSLFM